MARRCFPKLIVVMLALGITGCQGNDSTSNVVLSPMNTVTSTPLMVTLTIQIPSTPIPSPAASRTPTEKVTPTVTPTNTSTLTPTLSPETRLQVQCLDVLPEMPAGAISKGIVVLGRRSGNQVRSYDSYLLDMTTGKTTTISVLNETQQEHVVSLDRNLIAYYRFISDKDDNGIQQLVIATADGQIQKVIPWEDKWAYLQRWTSDQRILLTYDDPDLRDKENWSSVYAYLAYDPFSGEQELLHPIFPGHLRNIIGPPFWDGWFGAVYDPTLTRAITLKMLSENEELYTFALWNIPARELVSSLENIYVDPVLWSDAAPNPVWSEDGAYFAFVGHLNDSLPEFELYQVSHDGQVEQLTHITSIVRSRDWPIIWSPDGRKIAMILDLRPEIEGRNVLVLDLETKEISDTCISVKENLSMPEGFPMLWSPDGKQLLVKDWLDDSHNRIILVDIEQGFAAQIAENVDLNGWMISPEQ